MMDQLAGGMQILPYYPSCMQTVLNIISFYDYHTQTKCPHLTQLLRGENAGILWHRSRMTRIIMTHDCKPFAFAYRKRKKQSQQ